MKFHNDGSDPGETWVFVFGSNLSGRHGAGAAKAALDRHGAALGSFEGLMGMSYAIPTKGLLEHGLPVLSLAEIAESVDRFIAFSLLFPEACFFVTRIGCGLAGFSNQDIAPMFRHAGENCSFAQEWKPWLEY